MIKKGLSLLLCFVMLVSCFGVTLVEAHAGVVSAKTLFVVNGDAVKDGKLNYTISITAQQKGIAGAILVVEYDSSVLKPINCGPSMRSNSTEGTVQNFSGEFVYGVTDYNPDRYAIAYMSSSSESTETGAKKFFDMEFQVIDDSRPLTDIKFYCQEYYSTMEADKVITPDDGLQEIKFFTEVPTLEQPVLKTVSPCNEGIRVTWEKVIGATDGYVIYRKTPSTQWVYVGDVSGEDTTEFTDINLVSGTTYFYTVAAANQYGETTKNEVGISCKYVAKPVIENLRNVVGGIEIEWTPTAGADHYKVMRRVYGEDEWQLVSSRIAAAGEKYKDISVVDGEWYEYDVNSCTDTYETITSDYGAVIRYIVSPEIKKIVNTTEGITISWDANDSAVKYSVYRKEVGKDQQWVLIDETTLDSYTDTNVTAGKGYSYSIKAHSNDAESALDNIGLTYTFVPPVEVKTVTNNKYSVDITWDKVENAKRYRIYRRPANGTQWTSLGYVDGNTTSFSDTLATSGGVYVYGVGAVISNSESALVDSEAIYFLKAPGVVIPENVTDGILIKWDKVLGATEYKVYKSEDGYDFSLLGTVEDASILDTQVEFGKKYIYKVESISSQGNSPHSDVSKTFLRIEAIGKVTPSLSAGGIHTEWDPVEGVEYYALFRSKGETFVQIATVSENSYLDTMVESNVKYSYAVAAIVEGSRGVLNTDSPEELLYIAPPAGVKLQNRAGNTVISWEAVNGASEYQLYKGTSPDDMALIGDFGADTLSYVDSDVVPGVTYVYKLRTKGAEGYSVFSDLYKIMYLEVPKIKTLSNTYDGVKITWNKSAGAEGYKVYRRYGKGESWELIETLDASKLTYTDAGAANSKTVYYTVKAMGGESESYFASKSIIFIKAPQVTVTNGSKGVTVKWDKNTVAKSYYVYRKTPSAKGWSRIATVTVNSYTDKNVKSGQKYIYTVKAVGEKSHSGYNSAGWTIKYLAAPTLKNVTNAYNGAKVTWSAVKGANKYRVYRKAEGEKNWKSLGTTTKTYFVDKKAVDGKKCTYTVRAYYGAEKSGYNSKGITKLYIAAPKVEIKNNMSGVYLYWDEIDSASSYYVYRKAPGAKSWKKIATVTKNAYTDATAKSGVLYSYTVRAYGLKTLSGFNNSGWKIRFLKTPELVSATAGKTSITLKWKPVDGAQGYQIYRKDIGGTWEKIGTVKGGNRRSYVDKKAVKGERYKYTVKAYYGSYTSAYNSGINGKL